MIRMNVMIRVMRVQAERFVEPEDPLPGNVEISVNMNLGKIESTDERAKGKFVFDVSYRPSIARITVEGRLIVTGSKGEIKNFLEETKGGKMPQPIFQSVFSAGLSEVIILSRSIGVPPPLPPPSPKRDSSTMEYSL